MVITNRISRPIQNPVTQHDVIQAVKAVHDEIVPLIRNEIKAVHDQTGERLRDVEGQLALRFGKALEVENKRFLAEEVSKSLANVIAEVDRKAVDTAENLERFDKALQVLQDKFAGNLQTLQKSYEERLLLLHEQYTKMQADALEQIKAIVQSLPVPQVVNNLPAMQPVLPEMSPVIHVPNVVLPC